MNKKIYLRFVEEEDLEDLYNWRNDDLTREYAFNTGKIDFESHVNWFNNSIINPKRNIFIAYNKKKEKIGQIRFDKENNFAEIDVVIAPNQRGQGYGVLTIERGCSIFLNNFEVDYIIAKIKKENIASIKIFEKSGFKISQEHPGYFEFRLNKNE